MKRFFNYDKETGVAKVEVMKKGIKGTGYAKVHPDDAKRLGLVHGSQARVTSRVGSLVAPVEVTDSVRSGVVSLPHGWGHNVSGTKMSVAAEKPGVNSNILTDDERIDELSGNAVLNAIPVTVHSM